MIKKTLNFKKIISVILALTTVFSLTVITSFAEDIKVNAKSVRLYAIDSLCEKGGLKLSSEVKDKFQLSVSGAKNVFYSVKSGSSCTVSKDGLVEPKMTVWYWYNGFGTTSKIEGKEPSGITKDVNEGQSIISVFADGKELTVNVDVKSYANYYAEKNFKNFIKKEIKSSMTQFQKLEKIAAYTAREHDYGADASDAISMEILGRGDCWASTDMIIRLCKMAGIEAWARDGRLDGGGSGHMNVMSKCDGKYYQTEAGFVGKKPRFFSIFERDNLFLYTKTDDENGIELYRYDGNPAENKIVIPKTLDGLPITEIKCGFSTFHYKITSLSIPDTVKILDDYSLNGLSEIKEIKLPKNLEKIGEFALADTYKLSVIEIPESVNEIADNAFENSGLKVILGKKGSFAEKYAENHGYKFNETSSKKITVSGGKASSEYAKSGEVITLKANVPNGKSFVKWECTNGKAVIKNSSSQSASFVMPNENVIIRAVYRNSAVKKISMYRLYNPNSGEHFYTKDMAEKNHLVSLGWKYEGIGWTAPSYSNTPVYRLYNPNAGEHHYTLDKKEKNNLVKVGWNYEGIGWYSDDAKGVPLYRQYNPNAFACNHNYTKSKVENDWLVSLGWKYEGIGWYGVK